VTFKDFQKLDDKDSVIIDIKNSAAKAEKYFCSYCNTRLTPLTQEDMMGAYVCTKCTITYWPNQQSVKKSSKFDLPGPPTDSHGNVIGDNDIPIAVIDDVNKEVSSTIYKKQKLPAAYEALQKAGFRWPAVLVSSSHLEPKIATYLPLSIFFITLFATNIAIQITKLVNILCPIPINCLTQ
jgi:hypothetical protein